MNKTLFFTVATTFAAVSALADLYRGSIRGSVTYADPGSPGGWSVGNAVGGSYQYESSTKDGSFFGLWNLVESGTLSGGFGLASFRDANNWAAFVTVSGGSVTDVDLNGEAGGFEWWVDEGSFRFRQDGGPSAGGGLEVAGTLSFEPPSAVPDQDSAVALLAGAAVVVGWLRRVSSPPVWSA